MKITNNYDGVFIGGLSIVNTAQKRVIAFFNNFPHIHPRPSETLPSFFWLHNFVGKEAVAILLICFSFMAIIQRDSGRRAHNVETTNNDVDLYKCYLISIEIRLKTIYWILAKLFDIVTHNVMMSLWHYFWLFMTALLLEYLFPFFQWRRLCIVQTSKKIVTWRDKMRNERVTRYHLPTQYFMLLYQEPFGWEWVLSCYININSVLIYLIQTVLWSSKKSHHFTGTCLGPQWRIKSIALSLKQLKVSIMSVSLETDTAHIFLYSK